MGGVLAALLVAGLACAQRGDGEPETRGLTLTRVATGLESPVHVAAPSGDPRLFVVEQPGRIRIVKDGQLLKRPFLDIRDRVRSGGERGLLSVAFHPDYARNGRLFVNYTDRSGDTRVERYQVSANPDRADPASGQLVLKVDQPYPNHNGGHILFAPDGMLWIGMGDGGAGGDPHNHAQNRSVLLGKMLRIDVDRGSPYAIPPDNPFADGRGGRPEIWAWGVRNPWRFAFDRPEKRLYIADVGQNQWEEINVVPADAPGLDYGWRRREGSHPYEADGDTTRGVMPVLEYSRRDGCSITGGHVYRGRALPELVGHYFYADYCQGWIRSFRLANGSASERREWRLPGVGSISSFGEDARGELYVVAHSGSVYRLERAPASSSR
jgi:glucose/arabinose dehydrogenase